MIDDTEVELVTKHGNISTQDIDLKSFMLLFGRLYWQMKTLKVGVEYKEDILVETGKRFNRVEHNFPAGTNLQQLLTLLNGLTEEE
jgi:hypothetical protein